MNLTKLLETLDHSWEGCLSDTTWRRLRRTSPHMIELLTPERRRLSRMARHEREAAKDGAPCVAGLDEVGRGPMAGPLVAAAVVFKSHPWIVGLNDSKQLLPEERRALRDRILACAQYWAIGEVSVEEMASLNMHVANLLALERARQGLKCQPDLLLIDGRFPLRQTPERQVTLVKGDCRSYSIAAASIVAKVHRDAIMDQLHEVYPQYGFNSHKGYATPEHVEALQSHGPSPVHRPQFRRVRELLGT